MKEKLKCNYCKKDGTWITRNIFDIRISCDDHKDKLKKEIKAEGLYVNA